MGVLLQAFYWNCPSAENQQGTWWTYLQSKLPAIQAAGFAPYKMAVIVANGMANAVLGHGLAFAANAGLTKGIALFAGPVGWALDAIWGGTIIAVLLLPQDLRP